MEFTSALLIPPAMWVSVVVGVGFGYVWGRKVGMNIILDWVSGKLDELLEVSRHARDE